MNQVFSLKLIEDIVAGIFGEPPVPKPRAKHPTKVHVQAGISTRGAKKFFFPKESWMQNFIPLS